MNSVVLGGAAFNIDAAGRHLIAQSDPVATPLFPLNDSDVIKIELGRSSASDTNRVAGLTVTLWIKEELVG